MERFTIFRSYHEALRECPPEVRLEIFDAMMAYVFDGKDPEFKHSFSKAIWVLILPVINNSIKQAENGSKPNKNKVSSNKDPESIQTEAKQNPDNIQSETKPHPLKGVGEGIGKGNNKDNLLIVDYQRVVDLWNSICGLSNGKLRSLADSRKAKVRCRAEELTKQGLDYLQTFEEIFQKVSQTPFLQGNNPRGWKANFDWIFENDKNYLKVLENRYDQTPSQSITQPQQYGSRHLQDRANEESFYRQQSELASQFLMSDGDEGLVGAIQDD